MAHYFVLNFFAREDGVFLPSSYYNEIFGMIGDALSSHLYTITPIRTKNKKEVQDGIWVFNDFRIYLATPFVEIVSQNLFRLFNLLLNPFEGIYLQRITFKRICAKKSGTLLSGVFASLNGVALDYEKEPEIFSESLRKFLIKVYEKKFGKLPDDTRFFFLIKDNVKRQVLLPTRLEFFGNYEIFSSDELAEIFCQTFCVR